MEAEKFHHLLFASQRPKKASGMFSGLRARKTLVEILVHVLKA